MALANVDVNNMDSGSDGTIPILPIFYMSSSVSNNEGPDFVSKIVARKHLFYRLMDIYVYKYLHF